MSIDDRGLESAGARRRSNESGRPMGLALCLGVLASAGCTSPFLGNRPLQTYDAKQGYRFDQMELGPGNTDDLFVCLTFSGGGTRAATLSYSVLEALRDQEIPPLHPGDPPRRLLDEVDIISSVSGGSFTSLSYAMKRDALFDGSFEKRMLRKNVQRVLMSQVLRPINLIRMASKAFDRIGLAAAYYDQEIFERRTYGDLLANNQRPFVVVNATSVATGHRFEFSQDDFDLLGADLSQLRLSTAAAASSAFPILLSPVRLNYYDGVPVNSALAEALRAPSSESIIKRRYRWASTLISVDQPESQVDPVFDATNHRYIYLLDGGLADNLGVAHVLNETLDKGGSIHRRIVAGAVKRMVVVIVDAGVKKREQTERLPSAPGVFQVGYKTATLSIDNTSWALKKLAEHFLIAQPTGVQQALDTYAAEVQAVCPMAPSPQPVARGAQAYIVHVALHNVADLKRRDRFMHMPTSFYLPNQSVDELMEVGPELLQADPAYQRLLNDLSEEAANRAALPNKGAS